MDKGKTKQLTQHKELNSIKYQNLHFVQKHQKHLISAPGITLLCLKSQTLNSNIIKKNWKSQVNYCLNCKVRKESYLIVGQTDVLQHTTEVELLDGKFPETNKSFMYCVETNNSAFVESVNTNNHYFASLAVRCLSRTLVPKVSPSISSVAVANTFPALTRAAQLASASHGACHTKHIKVH